MDTIKKALKEYDRMKERFELGRSDLRIRLGNRLRIMRVTYGLSLAEFARSLDVSRTYLSEIERGHKIVTEKLLEKLKTLPKQ